MIREIHFPVGMSESVEWDILGDNNAVLPEGCPMGVLSLLVNWEPQLGDKLVGCYVNGNIVSNGGVVILGIIPTLEGAAWESGASAATVVVNENTALNSENCAVNFDKEMVGNALRFHIEAVTPLGANISLSSVTLLVSNDSGGV